MKNALFVVVGVLLVIAGAVWALQGFGYIGGSFMSGNSVWKIVGPVVGVAGLLIAGIGLRRGSRRTG